MERVRKNSAPKQPLFPSMDNYFEQLEVPDEIKKHFQDASLDVQFHA